MEEPIKKHYKILISLEAKDAETALSKASKNGLYEVEWWAEC